MRLIDLDKAVVIYDEDNNAVIHTNIKNAEVKAIPIEWLEKWKSGKTSIEQVVADKIMMDYKHRDYWEKENE